MFTNSHIVLAVVCGLLASSGSAHMVITSPVPYGQSTLNNSPLENDGSDFPCKLRDGVYDITTMNHMPVGVPQKLSFMGGATHGGGSCQVSVTLDKQPSKDSEWKVIQTILGGCPNSFDGNADSASTYTGNPTFDFTMPKGMPNGQYSLAWTWFNKIETERCMLPMIYRKTFEADTARYMNCAPITVTGGSDNNDVFDTLPDMFVINIPNEECSTIEGEDFVMPSPGLYVETYKNTALGSSTTGSDCAAVTIKGAGDKQAGSASQPTGEAGGSADSSVAASATSGGSASFSAPFVLRTKAPAEGSGSLSANNIVTSTSMLTVTAASPVPTDEGTSSAPAEGSATDGSNANGTSSSGQCSSGSVSCPTDGSIICMGSNQWGMCDHGCAVPMALAAGTSCSAGAISKRSLGHLQKHMWHARKI